MGGGRWTVLWYVQHHVAVVWCPLARGLAACSSALHLNSHPSQPSSSARALGGTSRSMAMVVCAASEALTTRITLKATVFCSNNSIHHPKHTQLYAACVRV
uniref:Putative secreted protein n=1 Tax=Anopheles marajoara TaxID=58244 RepID=A0A2M4C8Q5_9DIPT